MAATAAPPWTPTYVQGLRVLSPVSLSSSCQPESFQSEGILLLSEQTTLNQEITEVN